jgi:lactate dehydrogenase-like 2-hydroxyacid dehydrogenase
MQNQVKGNYLGFFFAVTLDFRYHQRRRASAETENALGAHFDQDLESLLANSDFVVLVLPYSPAVHHLIGRDQIRKMKV